MRSRAALRPASAKLGTLEPLDQRIEALRLFVIAKLITDQRLHPRLRTAHPDMASGGQAADVIQGPAFHAEHIGPV